MNQILKNFTHFTIHQLSTFLNYFKFTCINHFYGSELNLIADDLKSIVQKPNFTQTYKNLTLNKDLFVSQTKILEMCVNQIDHAKMQSLSKEISGVEENIQEATSIKVPWFPQKHSDINLIGKTLYQDKIPQNQSHPQFTDPVYRQRRNQIANIAQNYKIQHPIPNIDYSQEENDLWVHIVKNLIPLHQKYFCEKYLSKFDELNKIFKIDRKIPQLQQLSQHLQQKTGFRIKPVHGIVSQREFLNALAFRVFLSTQYLRHPATPEYTPEPDIVHEIIGHIPMFADKDIVDISQKIGEFSLGASDQEIKKLGTLYFITVEFGVCKEKGINKIYGAGFASCIKEIQNFSRGKARFKKLQPKIDCLEDITTQNIQNSYYITECFKSGLYQIESYGKEINKEIQTIYDPETKSIQCNQNFQFI